MKVTCADGGLTEELVRSHDILVMTRGSWEDYESWSSFCRANGTACIVSGVYGAAGFGYVDFGPTFQIHDANGEPPKQRAVLSLEQAEEGKTLIVLDDSKGALPHDIHDDDHEGWVTFTGVQGCQRKDDESKRYAPAESYKDYSYIIIESPCPSNQFGR